MKKRMLRAALVLLLVNSVLLTGCTGFRFTGQEEDLKSPCSW